MMRTKYAKLNNMIEGLMKKFKRISFHKDCFHLGNERKCVIIYALLFSKKEYTPLII